MNIKEVLKPRGPGNVRLALSHQLFARWVIVHDFCRLAADYFQSDLFQKTL